jgi:hypothetical protein
MVLPKFDLVINKSLIVQKPTFGVTGLEMLSSWIFKMELVDLRVAPFFLIKELSLITFPLLSLVPLEYLYVSFHFDRLESIIVEGIISNLDLGSQISDSMNKFKVIVVHYAVWIGLFAGLLRLLNELVDSHLLSLVKPNDGKGEPNQDDSANKFEKWRRFFLGGVPTSCSLSRICGGSSQTHQLVF